MNVVRRAWNEYRQNPKPGLVFALPLILIPFFAFFSQNVSLSSGTLFLEFVPVEPVSALGVLALALLSLAGFSFALTLVVLGVRKSLSKVKHSYLLPEMARVFVSKVFVFFLVYSIVFYALSFALLSLGAAPLQALLILLVLSLPFLYVPQALVVDETKLSVGVDDGVRFAFKNKRQVLTTLVVGSAMLAVAVIVGFLLNFFFLDLLPGRYLTLALVLTVIVPFVEVLKTYQYMMRFNLIKQSEKHVH